MIAVNQLTVLNVAWNQWIEARERIQPRMLTRMYIFVWLLLYVTSDRKNDNAYFLSDNIETAINGLEISFLGSIKLQRPILCKHSMRKLIFWIYSVSGIVKIHTNFSILVTNCILLLWLFLIRDWSDLEIWYYGNSPSPSRYINHMDERQFWDDLLIGLLYSFLCSIVIDFYT